MPVLPSTRVLWEGSGGLCRSIGRIDVLQTETLGLVNSLGFRTTTLEFSNILTSVYYYTTTYTYTFNFQQRVSISEERADAKKQSRVNKRRTCRNKVRSQSCKIEVVSRRRVWLELRKNKAVGDHTFGRSVLLIGRCVHGIGTITETKRSVRVRNWASRDVCKALGGVPERRSPERFPFRFVSLIFNKPILNHSWPRFQQGS